MKLWGGRFTKTTDSLVEDFHSSISFDKRLYYYDVMGSIAHAAMLGATGIISTAEAAEIATGLEAVLKDIESDTVQFASEAEDIHMNIEKLLTEKIGVTGKKLHTARSRNDQVALDIRMYVKDEIKEIIKLLINLSNTLLAQADKHRLTVMPGYTHLQKAQPITLAHHLLAYVQMFARDIDRLADCCRRADVMPLGSGALAGTTFPIDREMVREQLGFASITVNSLDAVSDRDFAIEFTAAASLIMVHLSRFCEEIILWSSNEFGFIRLDDAYSTGSSIMPQKKNPDVAELVRGKSGRVFGDLQALLTMMKGLPLAYNKDMQEDKEALFDAIDTVKKSLLVFTPMIATMQVNAERMAAGASGGFINATDMADYLAARGVPFREAHAVIGRLVLYCEENNCALDEIPLDTLKHFSDVFGGDIYAAISLEACINARAVEGGPAPAATAKAIERSREYLRQVEAFWN